MTGNTRNYNKGMIKIAISMLLGLLLLSGCGYDGAYRYECQDPANWGATECVPPECVATGQCTSDLIGFDPETLEGLTTEGTATNE